MCPPTIAADGNAPPIVAPANPPINPPAIFPALPIENAPPIAPPNIEPVTAPAAPPIAPVTAEVASIPVPPPGNPAFVAIKSPGAEAWSIPPPTPPIMLPTKVLAFRSLPVKYWSAFSSPKAAPRAASLVAGPTLEPAPRANAPTPTAPMAALLDIIVFGNDAWPIKIKDLPYLQVGPYHTNTVAGLELAMDLLRRKRNTNKQIFMITDGKPSCLRLPDGQYYKNSNGLDEMIVEKCYAVASQARKMHIAITTFMIAQDPYLQSFVEQFTKSNKGKAFYTGLKGLGEMIFHDYESNRKKRIN